MTISYIWTAEQTEPGMNKRRYAATATATPPADIEPAIAGDRLVYGESLYGPWMLLGTAKGACYETVMGSVIELDTPANQRRPMDVEDVVMLGAYRQS